MILIRIILFFYFKILIKNVFFLNKFLFIIFLSKINFFEKNSVKNRNHPTSKAVNREKKVVGMVYAYTLYHISRRVAYDTYSQQDLSTVPCEGAHTG